MNTVDFCNFASRKLVNDFVELNILSKDDALGARHVISCAMEAAVTHALLNVKTSFASFVAGNELFPSDNETENRLIEFINDLDPSA